MKLETSQSHIIALSYQQTNKQYSSIKNKKKDQINKHAGN